MKFNAVLMTLDQNTKIRLVVTMYGMKFSSEHYPEYYLDHKESDELLDKVVVDMRVSLFAYPISDSTKRLNAIIAYGCHDMM